MGAKWEQCGSLPPVLSTSEIMMPFSRYKSVRRVLGAVLLLVGLSLAVSPELLAQEAPEEESQSSEESTADPPPQIKRQAGQVAVYIEGATLGFLNGLVLNGEMSLSKHIAISGGWGASQAELVSTQFAHGPRFQIHYLAGGGTRLFELAAGVALAPWQNFSKQVPTFHIGYRWQHPLKGVLFRAGISAPQHNNSGGLSLSLGKAF
jgi:hypothetical protein